MVNPGSFSGRRKQFLEDQRELYAAAVNAKHVADTVADIQRRYFKRFPVTIPHTEEPSDNFLASVDDDAPDAELIHPVKNGMNDEEYSRAVRVYELHVAEIKMRKAQIKRRLHYQYTKEQGKATTYEIGTTDPMAVLMSKLTGATIQRPRHRTPYNIWGPANRCFVDPVFAERVKDGNVPPKRHAALRSAIYKELFEDLPEDERAEWIEKAEDEHQEALAKANSVLKAGPSTSPADRQRIIECIPKFVEPILDLIAEHTGWKITLLAGGPEPADGGRLNMLSVHSGTTNGAVKMNFGRSERVPYRDYIVPTFGKFLKKCYSVQECRDCALPDQGEFIGLSGTEDFNGVQIHTFDDGYTTKENEQYVKVAAPRPKTTSKTPIMSPSNKSVSAENEAATSTSAALRPLAPKPASPPKPLLIKVGPPKGKKKPTHVDTINESQNQLDFTAVPTKTLSGILGRESRPPTPPISRPPTPTLIEPSIQEFTTPLSNVRDPSLLHDVNTATTNHIVARAHTSPLWHGKRVTTTTSTRASSLPLEIHATTICDKVAPVRSSSAVPDFVHHKDPLGHAPAVSSAFQGAESKATSAVPRCDSIAIPSDTGAVVEEREYPALTSTSDNDSLPPFIPTDSCIPPHNVTSGSEDGANDDTAPSREDVDMDHLPSQARLSGTTVVPDLAAIGHSVSTRKRKGITGPTVESKRRKTSESTHTTSSNTPSISAPPDAPAWVDNAINLLASGQLGSTWDAVVASWLVFEAKEGYRDNGKLGTAHRPKFVSDWIQRRRSSAFRPKISNIDALADDVTAWWQSLQPEWRIHDDTEELLRDNGDFEDIRRPGVNGLLSVMATLFFWGTAMEGTDGVESAKNAWLNMLDDVSYVINHL